MSTNHLLLALIFCQISQTFSLSTLAHDRAMLRANNHQIVVILEWESYLAMSRRWIYSYADFYSESRLFEYYINTWRRETEG